MAEIHENCPGVKLVLTALKCDLRKDDEQNENPNAVAFDEGLAKAKEVGAVKYLGWFSSSFLSVHTKVFKVSCLMDWCRMLCSAEPGNPRDIL
jgi:hypothetical protein